MISPKKRKQQEHQKRNNGQLSSMYCMMSKAIIRISQKKKRKTKSKKKKRNKEWKETQTHLENRTYLSKYLLYIETVFPSSSSVFHHETSFVELCKSGTHPHVYAGSTFAPLDSYHHSEQKVDQQLGQSCILSELLDKCNKRKGDERQDRP